MPTYFAVQRTPGPAWNPALPMRRQALWNEHATFMDGLTAEGFVVLGGPLGSTEEIAEILLVVRAPGEQAVRARLTSDPWSTAGLLVLGRVEPWTILLDGRANTGEPEG